MWDDIKETEKGVDDLEKELDDWSEKMARKDKTMKDPDDETDVEPEVEKTSMFDHDM